MLASTSFLKNSGGFCVPEFPLLNSLYYFVSVMCTDINLNVLSINLFQYYIFRIWYELWQLHDVREFKFDLYCSLLPFNKRGKIDYLMKRYLIIVSYVILTPLTVYRCSKWTHFLFFISHIVNKFAVN